MLTLQLLDMRIELPLSSADLLRNQIGAVLQISTDVAHLMIPPTFNPPRSNDQNGEQFRSISSAPPNTSRRDFSATPPDPRVRSPYASQFEQKRPPRLENALQRQVKQRIVAKRRLRRKQPLWIAGISRNRLASVGAP
jgi:hypothetical protein